MPRLPSWARTYQIGLVVRDLDAAERHFVRMGVGPFAEGPSQIALNRRVYGQSAPDIEVRGRTASMGNVEFEIMQPIRGRSIQAEFLDRNGEGVVHLCAYTDRFDEESRALVQAGFPIVSYGEIHDGGRFAYFDTRAVGGLILELFEPGPEVR